MDAAKLSEYRKNIDFIDLMFRMSCSSTRLAFGAGLEMLSLDHEGGADEDIKNGRARLRAGILSQIKEFESLLKLVDG
ncbi:hypothetical protein [Rhizobium leguminosarum]|uniref:hypothetical protein n=1 Tax=Rhizobium leguminosarum TaxID=384 RepID=UPI0010301D03|nr:hypothetical protein [Rhizobium leguminosarum]TAY88088.1 hypothetical protein ELH83_09790 [Rhizobium leguminosarum]